MVAQIFSKVTFTMLVFILLIFFFFFIAIVHRIQKRHRNLSELVASAFMDAITLNSGALILLYVIGILAEIPYLTEDFENSAVLIALTFSGLVLIARSIDKLSLIRWPRTYRETPPVYPVEESPENNSNDPNNNSETPRRV